MAIRAAEARPAIPAPIMAIFKVDVFGQVTKMKVEGFYSLRTLRSLCTKMHIRWEKPRAFLIRLRQILCNREGDGETIHLALEATSLGKRMTLIWAD
jgi:hypothetical protein